MFSTFMTHKHIATEALVSPLVAVDAHYITCRLKKGHDDRQHPRSRSGQVIGVRLVFILYQAPIESKLKAFAII